MNRRNFLETICAFFGFSLLSGCKSKEPHPVAQPKNTRHPSSSKQRPKVVEVHNPKASAWDYQTGRYIDTIDQEVVYSMISKGIMTLTATTSLQNAWRLLLRDYRTGQKIAIKPNLNNTEIGYSEAIMTSPQVISALVRSLVEAYIPAETITVYDLTAGKIPDVLEALEPYGVNCLWRRESDRILERVALKLALGQDAPDKDLPIHMRKPVRTQAGKSVTCYLPKILSDTHHLINIPVFKAHQFVLHSNAFKNHFGTVRYSNYHQFPVLLHGSEIESHIVDINAHPVIRERTRLVLVDALFGAPLFTRGENGRIPTRWHTLSPHTTPNRLFFSTDPLAIETYAADYILTEQHQAGVNPYSYAYLKDAMNQGLGIHEHRDPTGRYSQIDTIRIDMTQKEIPNPNPGLNFQQPQKG